MMSTRILTNTLKIMISKNKRILLFKKYNGHCAYCGAQLQKDSFEVDHIKPKSKDGSNKMNNLMPSCHSCNQLKGSDEIEVFRLSMFWKQILGDLTLNNLNNFKNIKNKVKNYKFYFEKNEKK